MNTRTSTAFQRARLAQLKKYADSNCPDCDGDGWIEVTSNTDPTNSFPLRCQCAHDRYVKEHGPEDQEPS